jgi:hypothetical protein
MKTIPMILGLWQARGRTGADLRRAGKNGLRGIARFADPDTSADGAVSSARPLAYPTTRST